jgi:hypothetical protein
LTSILLPADEATLLRSPSEHQLDEAHRFGAPDWKAGDTIPLGGGTVQVLKVVWHDKDDDVAGR